MKRAFIIVVVLGFAGLLLFGVGMFGRDSSFHAGLNRYDGLPPEASDISVFQNKNMSGKFLADFKIREEDFVVFASQKQWPVQPITGSVFVFHAKAFHERRPNDKKEVTDGLYYSMRAANGGGVAVAYDRKDGRAYLDSSSR